MSRTIWGTFGAFFFRICIPGTFRKEKKMKAFLYRTSHRFEQKGNVDGLLENKDQYISYIVTYI